MTVYEFAEILLKDKEVNCGGIIRNEKEYVDAVGFPYEEEDGEIVENGEDLTKFYEAIYTLIGLQKKYTK